MKLTKQQRKELKKQEDCKHKNLKEIKVKDKKMLNGFYVNKKCLDCGCLFLSFKVEIAWIMQVMIKENPTENIDHPATFVRLCEEKGYLKPTPSIEQAKYLIQNKEKYL